MRHGIVELVQERNGDSERLSHPSGHCLQRCKYVLLAHFLMCSKEPRMHLPVQEHMLPVLFYNIVYFIYYWNKFSVFPFQHDHKRSIFIGNLPYGKLSLICHCPQSVSLNNNGHIQCGQLCCYDWSNMWSGAAISFTTLTILIFTFSLVF